jgi:sterol desaturase/sphingolipid hydroxylase (fatty acid hydroxylase superfamily)
MRPDPAVCCPHGWRVGDTPAVHRIHHSTALNHQDRNLGAITPIWDRGFGTFAAPHETVDHGIAGVAPRARRGGFMSIRGRAG